MSEREKIYYALEILMSNGQHSYRDREFMDWRYGDITSQDLKDKAISIIAEKLLSE